MFLCIIVRVYIDIVSLMCTCDTSQMNAITEYFMAKRKAMEAQARALEAGMNIKPKYEYDSDEDTEGGTWEHKKRMVEMSATQGKRLHHHTWVGAQVSNVF